MTAHHSPKPAPAHLRLEAGERPLPEYKLLAKLGEGAFGQVWRAAGPGGFSARLAKTFAAVAAEASFHRSCGRPVSRPAVVKRSGGARVWTVTSWAAAGPASASAAKAHVGRRMGR